MKEIKLTRGKVAIVDGEDYEYLSQFKWHCENGYASRTIHKNGRKTEEYMHRLIMNTPKDLDTDHINHNRLDNQRNNLRICTSSQNLANGKLRIDNKSGRKGVYWHTRDRRWVASIRYYGKRIHLGNYDNFERAVKIYEDKAKELFGEFA